MSAYSLVAMSAFSKWALVIERHSLDMTAIFATMMFDGDTVSDAGQTGSGQVEREPCVQEGGMFIVVNGRPSHRQSDDFIAQVIYETAAALLLGNRHQSLAALF